MLKTIICLAGGASQLPLIKVAKEAGYAVIVVDRNPDAPGFALADEKVIESTYATAEVLSALHTLEKRYQYCGLVARTSGPALKTAAAISEEFRLPGLSSDIIPLATEKSKLREFCEEHGILMPRGQKVTQVKDIAPTLSPPLIVKPDLPLIGKKNIRVVWETKYLVAALNSAVQSSGNGSAEVEEYIEGIDVSILFLLKYGQVKIIKYWDELNGITTTDHIKAIGVSVPSVIECHDVTDKLKSVAELFGQEFAQINTLIILSFRVDFSGNPYLIEMHGDLGGDLIADILLPAANPEFNYFDIVLDVSLDNELHKIYSYVKPTCMIYGVEQYPAELLQNAVIRGNVFYTHERDLLANLNGLSLMVDKSRLSLMKMPCHEDWFKARK